MKFLFRLFSITILATLAAFALNGCGKKDAAPEATETGLTEAEIAAAETEIAASEAALAAEKTEADAIAAQAADEAAEIASATAAADAETAAAAVAAEAKAEADAARIRADEETTSAKAQAEAAAAEAAAALEAEAAAAAAAAADAAAEAAADSIQKQANEILAKYSGEIDALKANVSKLAEIVDQNADALPAGVAEKYSELKTLVPEVSSMVQSLKDYKGTDLDNLVSKIESDYGKAADLYKEAMALIPEGLSLEGVKVPGM